MADKKTKTDETDMRDEQLQKSKIEDLPARAENDVKGVVPPNFPIRCHFRQAAIAV